MAKKKSHESNEESSAEAVTNHVIDLEQLPESEQSLPANEPTHPLMEEVQSFLNLRDELAKKLVVEMGAIPFCVHEMYGLCSVFCSFGFGFRSNTHGRGTPFP